jgi:predicted transcriptional regulator
LLREGRRQVTPAANAAGDARRVVLEFAPTPVAEIMTREVYQIAPDASVAAASALMYKSQVHRVFVSDGQTLAGVFSTLDAMTAIRDSAAKTPISELMSTPIEVVDVGATIATAVDQLEASQMSGLVAVENDWPVGVFTQVEALAARDLDAATLVEDAMDPALICMPVTTSIHRAAQQALRMRVRRIVASENRHMRGILSGLDFARYVARSA